MLKPLRMFQRGAGGEGFAFCMEPGCEFSIHMTCSRWPLVSAKALSRSFEIGAKKGGHRVFAL
jgi:hypothetical protein